MIRVASGPSDSSGMLARTLFFLQLEEVDCGLKSTSNCIIFHRIENGADNAHDKKYNDDERCFEF